MKDEFNQPREYDSPIEFPSEEAKEQFCSQTEDTANAPEFSSEHSPAGEYTYENVNDNPAPKRNIKKALANKIKLMGYVVAATVTVATITQTVYPDFSILPEPIVGEWEHNTSTPVPSQKPNTTVTPGPITGGLGGGPEDFDAEKPDTEFPNLSEDPNYYPNNEVLSSGMHEQFLSVKLSNGSLTYLYMAEDAPFGEIGSVEGMTYYPETNVLYMEDANVEAIYANMMGTGFSIFANGQNHVGNIVVYGYHYGGSLYIEGKGSLFVNEFEQYPVGIMLDAESSKSCLVVKDMHWLEVWGTKAAVAVVQSTRDKGIYYNNHMYGGKRITVLGNSVSELPTIYENPSIAYSIYDEDTYARHVIFTELTKDTENGVGDLGEPDPTPTPSPTETPSTSDDVLEDIDIPDSYWPDMAGTSNANPNRERYNPDYTDEFISVQLTDGSIEYIYTSQEEPFSGKDRVAGVKYDWLSNTLYLADVTLDAIYISRMGSNFTLSPTGVCNVGQIIVYGEGYGGSLNIESSEYAAAALIINKDKKNAIGILLDAEGCDAFLAVDEYTHVEAWGSTAAVAIANSSIHDGAIFYKGILLGGARESVYLKEDIESIPSGLASTDEYYYYSIFQRNPDRMSTHICFKAQW